MPYWMSSREGGSTDYLDPQGRRWEYWTPEEEARWKGLGAKVTVMDATQDMLNRTGGGHFGILSGEMSGDNFTNQPTHFGLMNDDPRRWRHIVAVRRPGQAGYGTTAKKDIYNTLLGPNQVITPFLKALMQTGYFDDPTITNPIVPPVGTIAAK